MHFVNDNRKIGIGLTGFGALFLMLGVILLFDKALLALGNIMFLAGICLLIGAEKTFRFFFRKHKLRGTFCFLGGIMLVLYGWPMIGMIIEVFGIFNLFGNFFPIVVSFFRRMPIIGPVLNVPIIAKFIDKCLGTLPFYSDRSR